MPMKRLVSSALVASAALLAVASASAHFILLAPDAWVEVNQLGDPQKAAPCGTSDLTTGAPTGKVTALKGGDTVHI
jgi:hypothetical protein